MKELSPLAQDVLRQISVGGEWTFWPYEGWVVRTFNKLVELGFAEVVIDPTSKQWGGRMWRVTEAGKLKAQSIPETISGLKRSVELWNGR